MASTENVVRCGAVLIVIASAAACAHEPVAITTGDAGASESSAAPSSSSVIATEKAPAASSNVARGASVKIPLDGFVLSCNGHPKVAVAEADGGTRIVNQQLPGKGMYFLDDKFTGYGMCDVVVCSAATEASVDLVEYQPAGTRAVPAGQGSTGKAPIFHVAPLVGNVEVTVDYFANSICTVPKTVTKTFVVR